MMLEDLLALLAQYRSILTLGSAILLPRLLPRLVSLLQNRGRGTLRSQPLPNTLKGFLAVHSLYQAYRLLVPPYNVFTFNRLPLLVPQDVLRSVILGSVAQSTDLDLQADAHPLVELLLQKLSRLDGRYLYSRYGHDTVLNCVWCTDSLDYLLYSIPGILGPYVLQGVLFGLMSMYAVGGMEAERRAKAWRSWMGWVLVIGAASEAATKYLWTLRAVQGQCTHLAPNIHIIRSLCLLLLPIIYAILPLPPISLSPHSLIPMLANTQNTLRLSSLSRSAIWRDPRLRTTQAALTDEQIRAEESAKNSLSVKSAVADAGVSEEQVRTEARRWIAEGWAGLVRVRSAENRPHS